MNADLEHLVTLQAIDLELRQLRAELADAPKRVAKGEADKKRAESLLAAAKQALQKEEVLRRSQQNDVNDKRGKIKRLQKQMETATSGAQITALEHEISFAEQTISKLEDEELASMERTEKSEADEAKATALLAQTTATLEAERLRAAAVLKANTAAVSAHEVERAALRPQITDTPLANYDRVSKSRGTGIAEAVDHKCSACQMMLRPQRWNDLTGRDFKEALFPCETCSRTLFWDPRRDAPGPWPPGDRLNAALKTTEVRA
jgi:predicted  nucleic acid-binding Zn-ribbon protein